MLLTPDQIAKVCHQAHRVLQIANGEEPSPPWDDAPSWQRSAAREGVTYCLTASSVTPEMLHEHWRDDKLSRGWIRGSVKDEDARTHPCLVPYDRLPPGQMVKPNVFLAIVRALANGG